MYCGFQTKRNKCFWLISLLFVIGAVLAAIVLGSQIPKCGKEVDGLPKDDGALLRTTLFWVIPSFYQFLLAGYCSGQQHHSCDTIFVTLMCWHAHALQARILARHRGMLQESRGSAVQARA
jgi:hypothetical protein